MLANLSNGFVASWCFRSISFIKCLFVHCLKLHFLILDYFQDFNWRSFDKMSNRQGSSPWKIINNFICLILVLSIKHFDLLLALFPFWFVCVNYIFENDEIIFCVFCFKFQNQSGVYMGKPWLIEVIHKASRYHLI